MGYVSIGMGDHFSAFLVSLMALRHALVDQNPIQPSFSLFSIDDTHMYFVDLTGTVFFKFIVLNYMD